LVGLKAGLVLGLMLCIYAWGNQGVVKFSRMGKAIPEVGLKAGLLGICFGIDVTYVRAAGQSRSCPSHLLEEGALCEGFVKRSAAWDR